MVEAIKKSEETKEALLRTIPDLIYQIDRSGHLLSIIPSKDFGFVLPPKQISGKRIDETLPLQLAHQTLEHIEKTLETGEITVFEYVLDVEGEERSFETRQVACGQDQFWAW